MSFVKKIPGRLVLRCLGAVALGVGATAVFTFSLATYADFGEPDMPFSSQAAAIPYPETPQDMQVLTRRFIGEVAPQDISPAAGGEDAVEKDTE